MGLNTPVLVLRPAGLTPLCLRASAALGEDMADEYVHPDPAGVHRRAVGREVHHGVSGVPLHPHHDGAAAPPHPVQDFRGTRAAGGRLYSPVILGMIFCHQNLIPGSFEILILQGYFQIQGT